MIEYKNGFDKLCFVTDKKVYDVFSMACKREGENSVFYDDTAAFSVCYQVVENSCFIKRNITAVFQDTTTLIEVKCGLPSDFDCFMYHTFFNASAAVFGRKEDNGICVGFENPFCRLNGDFVSFEPSLILKPNEPFECDANFIGEYTLWGEMISPKLYKTQMNFGGRFAPRYRNPSEGIPLYFSEIFEFNKYTADYFECDKKQFKFMTYDFFGNMVMRPENEEDVKRYCDHIDAVKTLGCDTILLNPLCANAIPNADENSLWELFPEGSFAEKIFLYAKEKGLKIGSYTGTAGNGLNGNSPMIAFTDYQPWRKTDISGHRGSENCIADDDFAAWYIRVQNNTINTYSLDVWNWDPGPGNGFFCYSSEHGHLPGKGGYKGFRNGLKVMKALKSNRPSLYYQGFHGLKEYGIWGFKYTDQHEAYWENENYVMNPVFDDLSADRVTADNIRLQSVWNYYFRFMPQTLNHGISHRMVQANWMGLRDFDEVLDLCGYRYALLSAIAVGGSVTPTIIPRHPEKYPEYLAFYNKWIAFAKDIFRYSDHTVPFGAQVGCGMDAYAKILDNKGYIFIFNPDGKDRTFAFDLSRRIGLSKTEKPFHIGMIYPYGKQSVRYSFGDGVTVPVAAYDCVVLKISDRAFGENEITQKPLPRVIEGKDNKYVFFGDEKIKEYLKRGEEYQSERGIRALEQWGSSFNRVNKTWGYPDRLWLSFLPMTRDCSLRVNGHDVMVRIDTIAHLMSVDGMAFADITDDVIFGGENEITVIGNADNTVYLSYYKPTNEQIPDTRHTDFSRGCFAPVLDKTVQVLSAKITEDSVISPCADLTLTATVNLPYDELEGVYASVPISITTKDNSMRMDMALTYQDGVWYKTFNPDRRLGLIIDDEKIVLWAVTKDGRESDGYHLPIHWLL